MDRSEDPLVLFNDIKQGIISLEEVKNLQQDYEKYLKDIQKGTKSVEQKKPIPNINVLFNAKNNAIKFIEDYGSLILEAKRLAKQERRGLIILTPKQMLQRLLIALEQIKAGNNSESLLNEIRQIVYSFFVNQRELLKKYIIT